MAACLLAASQHFVLPAVGCSSSSISFSHLLVALEGLLLLLCSLVILLMIELALLYRCARPMAPLLGPPPAARKTDDFSVVLDGIE